MKHGCKMNTVVLKSFNDRLKIATVSALMAGGVLCFPFSAQSGRDVLVSTFHGICRKSFDIRC